jgi:two-component system, LytTR family, response regulator
MAEALTCLILDDEPIALDILKDYVSKVSSLTCLGAFRNSIDALTFLQAHPVDLIFLDINMPGLSGLQFLAALSRPPRVIFTTAYSEFAVASYDFHAVDYLLKPIEFPRFIKAVNKALDVAAIPGSPGKTILIKSGTKLFQLQLAEIRYLQAAGNYVSFFVKDKEVLGSITMKEALAALPARTFIRIHKSYIVNLRHVKVVENDQLLLAGRALPIGDLYRKAFFEALEESNRL